MRFFFYGTLMDADVRRAILGPRAFTASEPAVLAGWRRVGIAGVLYPMIVRSAGSRVDGVLVHGVDSRGRRLLEVYEGKEYALVQLDVTADDRRVSACIFVPRRGSAMRARGPWEFVSWRRRFKRRFLIRLRSQALGRRSAQPSVT